MSDPAPKPRPASPAAILVAAVGFALFLVPLYYVYLRHRPTAWYIPESGAAERLDPGDAWQATPAGRLEYLEQLRAKQEEQLGSYAWVDRKHGVVQIPIEEAMRLVVREYGPKQP